MKLRYNGQRWVIGEHELNCGQQVQFEAMTVDGQSVWVWGRFEIADHNNPVFYTTFGRVAPDLAYCNFRLSSARGGL